MREGTIEQVLLGDADWAVEVGDVAKVHNRLPHSSVGLVFTSPPYGAARTYGIDFDLRGQAWVEWAVTRYLGCMRVCRGITAWVVNGTTRDHEWDGLPVLLHADLIRRGVVTRKPPIYMRDGVPGSGGKDWFKDRYETIICAQSRPGPLPWSDNTACGKPPKYGPGGAMSNRTKDGKRVNEKGRDEWGFAPTSKGGRRANGKYRTVAAGREIDRFHTKHRAGGVMETQGYTVPKLANPGNVIFGSVGGGKMGHSLASENEAPFPLWLAEFFVKSLLAPNDIVLDPMCGSGTTLHAALKHGRRAIGLDIRESQAKLTRERMRSL